MKFKKSLLSALVVSGLSLAGSAHAGQTNFNWGNGVPGNLALNQTSLDWNEQGSGVAKGRGPFGNVPALLPGQKFQFLYQSNLVNVNPTGTPVAGLDTSSNGVWASPSSFEFTLVATINEVVDTLTAIPGAPGDPDVGYFASFGLDTSLHSSISIYYDSAAGGGLNASTATGTGFDDGLEVLRMTVDTGVPGFATLSSFLATTAGPGAGTGQGSAKIHAAKDLAFGDFVDENYFQGLLDFIWDSEFQSNLNYPSGTSSTVGFHVGGDPMYPSYAVVPCTPGATTCDLLLKVDGQSEFTVPMDVPEPASLVLLGLGLLGLGATRRRQA